MDLKVDQSLSSVFNLPAHFAFRRCHFEKTKIFTSNGRGGMADSSVPPIFESDLITMKLPYKWDALNKISISSRPVMATIALHEIDWSVH